MRREGERREGEVGGREGEREKERREGERGRTFIYAYS